MQKLLYYGILTVILFSFSSTSMHAQEWDYLDVEQGFETLNLAVEGDTTATGEPKSVNRVYRLERGGYYLLNGSVRGHSDVPLRIFAAEGDGPRPILIPAVDESGSGSRLFLPRDDISIKGLYVTSLDNLANLTNDTKNLIRVGQKGARVEIDDCFMDHEAQSFVRMNADSQSVFMTNTIARNAILIGSPGNGRYIDTRGNTQDTLFIQNCTWYLNSSNAIYDRRGIINNIILDHVTIYLSGENDEAGLPYRRAINGQLTNSLLIDIGYEGDIHPTDSLAAVNDSLANDIVHIDSLNAPDLATDAERTIRIENNVYGWSPELLEFFAGIDTVTAWAWQDARTEWFVNVYDGIVSQNNIEEYPGFSDAPSPAGVIEFAAHRLATNFSDEGNPDPRVDRNGIKKLEDDPSSFGPAEDEYDFDYPTSAQAYTHAEGGFPVGDLNWFPDKKAEWEDWLTSVDEDEAASAVPSHFSLGQNYPNPFNPVTTIEYNLQETADVELVVYNALGQKVATLVAGQMQYSGHHSVSWNGTDDSGIQVASGIYLYRLKAGKQAATKKMILMK